MNCFSYQKINQIKVNHWIEDPNEEEDDNKLENGKVSLFEQRKPDKIQSFVLAIAI